MRSNYTQPATRGVSNFDTVRIGIGLALFQIGAPLAWIVRELAHGGKSPAFSAALLLLGIGLMANYAGLRKGQLYASLTELGAILSPILIITAFAVVTQYPLVAGGGSMDKRQLIVNSVLIWAIIAGYSQPVSAYRHIHRTVAVVGTIVALTSLLYAISSVGTLAQFVAAGRFGGFGSTAYGGDSAPVLVARTATITLASAWIWYREDQRGHRWPATITLLLAIAAAGSMFLLARSRTNMLGAVMLILLATVFALIRAKLHGKKNIIRRRVGLTRNGIAFAVLFLFSCIFAWQNVNKYLSKLITVGIGFLQNGAISMLGGGLSEVGSIGVHDESAAMRKAFLRNALNTFHIMGNGYNSLFIDNPIAESFYDFGIVGGAAYTLIVLIIPLKISYDLALRPTLPTYIKFAIAAYILQMPLLLLSTTPYEGTNWYFVILFYVVTGRYWSRSCAKLGRRTHYLLNHSSR